jgi:hypothetical protein
MEIDRAERFSERLAEAYGDALVSVVLYGSGARGEYREGLSDLNVLVLLREASCRTLWRGAALAREWAEDGNPPPMVLAEDEWRGSADVFAIELSEIREAHRVLRGIDPFDGVAVDPGHLRLQCESELKGKKIHLREAYLLVADDPEALGDLLLHSFSTFLVLFRAVLRLTGDPEREAEAVVRRVAERAGIDPAPLLEVHAARVEDRPLEPEPDDPLVEGYLDAVAGVVAYVDRMGSGA